MRNDEFDRLYAGQAKALLRFLVYRTGDQALSEDLLADTFERVLTARRPFDPRLSSEKTWLYTIALNVLRDYQRRSAAGQRMLDRVHATMREPRTTNELETVENRDALQRALRVLTPEEREVVALRYGAQLRVNEIARLMRQKRSTIHGRLYGALAKLRDELGSA